MYDKEVPDNQPLDEEVEADIAEFESEDFTDEEKS